MPEGVGYGPQTTPEGPPVGPTAFDLDRFLQGMNLLELMRQMAQSAPDPTPQTSLAAPSAAERPASQAQPQGGDGRMTVGVQAQGEAPLQSEQPGVNIMNELEPIAIQLARKVRTADYGRAIAERLWSGSAHKAPTVKGQRSPAPLDISIEAPPTEIQLGKAKPNAFSVTTPISGDQPIPNWPGAPGAELPPIDIPLGEPQMLASRGNPARQGGAKRDAKKNREVSQMVKLAESIAKKAAVGFGVPGKGSIPMSSVNREFVDAVSNARGGQPVVGWDPSKLTPAELRLLNSMRAKKKP